MSEASSPGSGTRARDLLTVDRRRILVTFGAAILVFRRRSVPPPRLRERRQRQSDSRHRVVRRSCRRRPDIRPSRRRYRPLRSVGAERSRGAVRHRFARTGLSRCLCAAARPRARCAGGTRQRSLHLVSRRPGSRNDPRDERDHGRADAWPYARAHMRDVPLIRPDLPCRTRSTLNSPASPSS